MTSRRDFCKAAAAAATPAFMLGRGTAAETGNSPPARGESFFLTRGIVLVVRDVSTYASRGIRHLTSFGAWLDGDYVKRFGEPPVDEYGAAIAGGKPPARR